MQGSTSLRNAVKRSKHGERAQPAERKKLGLLEKHKDYVVRAKNYKQKKQVLKKLAEKAENRNPDEFYFQMQSSKVVNGVHKKSALNNLDNSFIENLKTQDLGYINFKKSIDDHKIERLQSSLHNIGASRSKNHKIFVENCDAVESFDFAKHFDTSEDLLHRSFNRPTSKTISQLNGASRTLSTRRRAVGPGKSYKELEERSKRSKVLTAAASDLSLKKELSKKGTKRKIILEKADEELGIKEKCVFKWKRQRQK